MTIAPHISADEFPGLGLQIAGCDRWASYKRGANVDRFAANYGAMPETCSLMWDDLRHSDNDDARLQPKDEPRMLLIALRFLFKCPTETDLKQFFNVGSEKTIRKYVQKWIRRLQLLLPSVLGGFDDHDEGLNFVFTIDGVHCPTEEPRPFSTRWSSHKFGGKVNYELAIVINKPQLAWVHGPLPPGEFNDIATFKKKLKQKMEDELPGKRIIGDKGHQGEPKLISTRNEFDPKEVAEFKDRALARHETFNQRLKCFACLRTPFRHGKGPELIGNHKICFEACCAVTMCQIESGGTSLFDPCPREEASTLVAEVRRSTKEN